MDIRESAKQASQESDNTKRPAMLKHAGMMAVCCGLPVALALAIPLLGFQLGSLEYLLPLLCPLLMVLMCVHMFRHHR